MNKKIFTLLASSLMLFMAVFSVNAQSSHWTGDTVQYLPKGVGKGAYHLMVTYKGDTPMPVSGPTGPQLLAMDEFGYVGFQDSTFIYKNYNQLRQALWCVNVARESQGQDPTFRFTNKEYSLDFAVTDLPSSFPGSAYTVVCASDAPPAEKFSVIRQVMTDPNSAKVGQTTVYSAGNLTEWAFSQSFDSSPLQTNRFLRIEIEDEPDYYLTLAVKSKTGAGADSLFLVKAHENDFKPGAPLYDDHLVFFTLVHAAPRVLSAEDFNTKLHEAAEGFVTLTWDPDVTANQKNVFAQPLKAKDASTLPTTGGTPGNHYLNLYNEANNYLYVDKSYYNGLGRQYPIIKDDAAGVDNTTGRDEFRLVYYPSADSLVINAREAFHAAGIDKVEDTNATGVYPLKEGLYSHDILNFLIVRMQNLDNSLKDRVITVYSEPANTRASFGIGDCQTVDPNRTTLPPDLYTVRDTRGRYLAVPLSAGDFTPQWIELTVDSQGGAKDTLERVLKTPSYQWFVTQVHEGEGTSRIFLTNRELNFIRLEYVQVYKTPQKFSAYWTYLTDSLNPGATYIMDNTDAYVSVNSYQIVKDDRVASDKKKELIEEYGIKPVGPAGHQVPAWMEHMPQDLMQKLYRTGPFLGYKAILPDTLNYYGYSFEILHKLGAGYFGVTEEKNKDNKDTILYVMPDRTFFELVLPDTLRAYGREHYGVGHDGAYQKYDRTKDIAPLERYYYYFMINDYYKFNWNDNYLVLDDNGRYGYTNEANANARKLNKAKFYMRFTYEQSATEYYTLLDRIDKSNFGYFTSVTGLSITAVLKAVDASHGNISNKAFGVATAKMDDYNRYLKAMPKVDAKSVSTFALAQMNDELYRRFNTADETCGRGEKDDEPRTLKFYRYNGPHDFVFENEHGPNNVPNSGIRFMGVENENTCNPADGQWHKDHNYAIYVDTAFVNRGTGWIKPQYLLVVNPKIDAGGTGCNSCGDSIDFRPYVYGRYLRNETDSARVNGTPKGTILNENYLWEGWERLAFTEAIHVGDSLYILNGTPISALYSTDKDGKQYVNFARADKYPNIKIKKLDDNFHKDEVFSMRFVERQRDKMGNKIEGASKRFLIESETTNRDKTKGRMIAPTQGGWVKYQNFVPVLSRGSFKNAINEAEVWDVLCASVDEDPTNTEKVSTDNVIVASGNGSVSILNAAGKKVVITNVLGQIIAQEVLTSDDVPFQAPKGVVVVAIEGHDTVKTIVK